MAIVLGRVGVELKLQNCDNSWVWEQLLVCVPRRYFRSGNSSVGVGGPNSPQNWMVDPLGAVVI